MARYTGNREFLLASLLAEKNTPALHSIWKGDAYSVGDNVLMTRLYQGAFGDCAETLLDDIAVQGLASLVNEVTLTEAKVQQVPPRAASPLPAELPDPLGR